MEPPKRYIERILEICVTLAFSAYLLRLAVTYILEIWPYLVGIASIILIITIGFRIWKYIRDIRKW